MKKTLRTFLILMLAAGAAKGQWSNNGEWSYNFGLKTGVINTLGTNTSSSATIEDFLPMTPSGNAGVFISETATSGSFQLNGDNSLTQRLPIASFDRFSVNSVQIATDVVMHSFKIKFSGAIATADAGNYIYAIGNHQGNLFNQKSKSSVYRSSSEIFTALRLTPVSTANSTGIKLEYRLGSDASATTTYTLIDQTTFAKGNTYDVSVYCNNSSISQIYSIGASSYTLPSNTFNLWVNGIQIGGNYPRSIEVTGNLGLSGGTSIAMSNGTALNSFLFIASGSSGATGSITLSAPKLTYLTLSTPVSLTSFNASKAQNGVQLKWQTASEQNNQYFDVLRSLNGKDFVSIGIVNGAGTTSEAKSYSFIDNSAVSGYNYYKLKQVDGDGKSTVYENRVQSVNWGFSEDNVSAYFSADKLIVQFNSDNAGEGNIKLVTVGGKQVFLKKVNVTRGNNEFVCEATGTVSGIYLVKVNTGENVKNMKIIK